VDQRAAGAAVIGREGRGPERPGPDYPPEWDTEPDWLDEPDDDDDEAHAVLHPWYFPDCDDCDERAARLEQQRL
jgi:hypothetical protein